MRSRSFTFVSQDGTEIFVYCWMPDEQTKAKGIVQIAHGMAETAARYERFAEKLTASGYIVYINDHRGHGRTAGVVERVGYLADENGFEKLVEDMYSLSCIALTDYTDLPLFIMGHSMGSFAVQRYIALHSEILRGAILSGSNGRQGILLDIGAFLAKREMKRHGRKAKSERLNSLSFGSFNNAFKPNRTEFDWLTRDPEEVDKYVRDPFCGTVFTCGFFYDFFKGLKEIEKSTNISSISKTLPIYMFSGDRDPVGRNGKGVLQLFNTYKRYGIRDLTCKLYKDGRHEMLNETNRDEVMADVIEWLDKHID